MHRPFASALRALFPSIAFAIARPRRAKTRRVRLLALLMIVGSGLGWATTASAFDPEWNWTALSQSFPTKQQAEAHGWNSGNVDARYFFLTKEKRLLPAGDYERYQYSAPKTTPIYDDNWTYQDGVYSSPNGRSCRCWRSCTSDR
jgi:hypothetical protein